MRLIEHPKLKGQWPPEVNGCFEEGLSNERYFEERQRPILVGIDRKEATANKKNDYSYSIKLTFRYGEKECSSFIIVVRDQEFLDKLYSKLTKSKGLSINEISDLELDNFKNNS